MGSDPETTLIVDAIILSLVHLCDSFSIPYNSYARFTISSDGHSSTRQVAHTMDITRDGHESDHSPHSRFERREPRDFLPD